MGRYSHSSSLDAAIRGMLRDCSEIIKKSIKSCDDFLVGDSAYGKRKKEKLKRDLGVVMGAIKKVRSPDPLVSMHSDSDFTASMRLCEVVIGGLVRKIDEDLMVSNSRSADKTRTDLIAVMEAIKSVRPSLLDGDQFQSDSDGEDS